MKSHQKPAKCYMSRSVARNMLRQRYGNKRMGQAWRRARVQQLGELGYALELLRTSTKKKQTITF
jgi:hypothetical protein